MLCINTLLYAIAFTLIYIPLVKYSELPKAFLVSLIPVALILRIITTIKSRSELTNYQIEQLKRSPIKNKISKINLSLAFLIILLITLFSTTNSPFETEQRQEKVRELVTMLKKNIPIEGMTDIQYAKANDEVILTFGIKKSASAPTKTREIVTSVCDTDIFYNFVRNGTKLRFIFRTTDNQGVTSATSKDCK